MLSPSLLYSKAVRLYTHPVFIYMLFCDGLPQDIEYSSLHCSGNLFFVHSIYKSLHLLTPTSHSFPPPWQPSASSLCL